MRLSVASTALAVAFILAPVVAGDAPALGQDFSITNQVEPANKGRRDVMGQLQALWDAHAYYPQHASNNEESGTVKVHLVVLPDGRIWKVDVVGSSGSRSLDAAGSAVFSGGSIRPFPAQGESQADVDLSLHYVLAFRHNQPVVAGYAPMLSKGTLQELATQMQAALKSGDTATAARLSELLNAGLAGAAAARPGAPAPSAAADIANPKSRPPFTITNEPVKSPILETMLKRTCTGAMTLAGIANYPVYGMHFWAQAVFFRKPDGTPWVKFYERGYDSLSPVTQVGKMVSWTGREEHYGPMGEIWLQYTVWPDGDNHLHGAIGSRIFKFGVVYTGNVPGSSVDLTCATDVLPTVTWNDSLGQSTATSPVDLAPADPP